MKSLLEYAPHHLIEENEKQPAILTGILPVSFSDSNAPIEASKSVWVHNKDPQVLSRLFEFESFEGLKYFLDGLLDYQEHIQHHATLTIENLSIYVEAFTHDINRVTELDLNLAKFCDEICDDLIYVSRMRKEREYVINE